MNISMKMMIVASVCFASSAYAVDPKLSDVTCEQLGENLELTEEAKTRFADLRGTCEGVYEIDGHLYSRTQAEVRSRQRNKIVIYLPATDHTFSVTPDPEGHVWFGDRKVRASSVRRGDSLGIYVSVDKFTQDKVDEIHFAAADDSEVEIMPAVVEPVEALPTTASSLPLLALLSALLLGMGLMLRRFS